MNFWTGSRSIVPGVTTRMSSVVQSSSRRFEELLEEWETQTVEFKGSVNPTNAHDFVQTVVAFSNTDGGTIFIGVENNGTVAGIRSPETVEQTIANFIEEFCEPAVSPSLRRGRTGKSQGPCCLHP